MMIGGNNNKKNISVATKFHTKLFFTTTVREKQL
jgi:hypothetical protein